MKQDVFTAQVYIVPFPLHTGFALHISLVIYRF